MIDKRLKLKLPGLPIRFGQRGYKVRVLQRFLFARGYTVPEKLRGLFGRETEKGVRELQKDYDLPQTGIFSLPEVKELKDHRIDYFAWCSACLRRLTPVKIEKLSKKEASEATLRRVQAAFKRKRAFLKSDLLYPRHAGGADGSLTAVLNGERLVYFSVERFNGSVKWAQAREANARERRKLGSLIKRKMLEKGGAVQGHHRCYFLVESSR